MLILFRKLRTIKYNTICVLLFIDIKECAQAVNKNMLELVSSKHSTSAKVFTNLNLDSIMEVLRQYLTNSSVETKVAVLKWIHHLFTEAKDEVHG